MMESSSPSSPRAFVSGITGQDGYYLARLLLQRGFDVYGGAHRPFSPLAREVERELSGLKLVKFDLLDPPSIEAALRQAMPDQIFHLAAQSNVGASWKNPVQTLQINAAGTLHLLKAILRVVPRARLVFAGSGDCFDHGAAAPEGISPDTPLQCTNPYTISKASAMQFVHCYREEKELHASVAILMNHVSPRRSKGFVDRKIIAGSVRIAQGKDKTLALGSLERRRDWSWAEDIVEALAKMGDQPEPNDFVLGSGQLHTTGDWVRGTFERFGLEESKHFELDPSLLHPGDRQHTFGEIGPAAEKLAWEPSTSFDEMIKRLIDAELSSTPVAS